MDEVVQQFDFSFQPSINQRRIHKLRASAMKLPETKLVLGKTIEEWIAEIGRALEHP